jgi:hypothetical protein
MYQRNITGPALPSAGKTQPWRKFQSTCNPADTVEYLAYFVGAKVKYLNALVGRCTAEQYTVDAVLDVQIGFALLAVAQNVQPSRILCKLTHEIENMPVAVALAEDRYKAKNARFHAVPFGVGSDHPLARELRGTVK